MHHNTWHKNKKFFKKWLPSLATMALWVGSIRFIYALGLADWD